MLLPKIVVKKKQDLFWYAIFVYATIIVDIYRKINVLIFPLPIATTTIRNVLYVSLFIIIIWKLYKGGLNINQVFAWSIGFGVYLLFSYLINIDKPGVFSLSINVLFMFISRLLPAMFIAKAIVGRENEFLSQICRLRIIPLLYIVIIFMRPETSESAYITISSNLVLPVLVLLLTKENFVPKLLNWIVGIIGLVVIAIYGGRGGLVACIVSLGLYFIFMSFERRVSNIKKFLIIVTGVSIVIIFFLLYDQIIELLLTINPSSRTLNLLSRGDFLWTSGRNSYYDAALESFRTYPFRVYGFLGDRYYFADFFGSGYSVDFIETMFAHNVFYEWMLNFGVFIGAGIIAFFAFRVFRTSRYLINDRNRIIFFSIFFGIVITSMLTSSSYLNDYMIWFLWGWMAQYIHSINIKSYMDTGTLRRGVAK